MNSLFFLLIGPSRLPPAKIVYPTSDMQQVHFQFTQENIVSSGGIINLCLIQPYHSGRTVTTVKINKTSTNDLPPGPGLSAMLKRKELRGQRGLVHFIKIVGIHGGNANNRSRDNKELINLQKRLESTRFICSVEDGNQTDMSSSVSFELNLTNEQTGEKINTYILEHNEKTNVISLSLQKHLQWVMTTVLLTLSDLLQQFLHRRDRQPLQ